MKKQFASIRNLISKGSRAAKLNILGTEPPLQMPSWRGKLKDRDISAVAAYAISMHRWKRMTLGMKSLNDTKAKS